MMNDSNELTSGLTWIVVADASSAEIYSRQKRYSQLELVQCLAEPAARNKEGELSSDEPGRAYDSGGKGRHAMEPSHSGKQHLRETFAHRIAGEIESARNADDFQHLILVAAPATLGDLRAQLSKATQRLVQAEVDKHMTGQGPMAIATLIDNAFG
jgi:protein required for attachment to host cells